jgi:hypothetical protein
MRYAATIALALGLASPFAHAQTSASFKLTESTFNAGGDPQNGTSAASASFHIKLDAIGDAVAGGTPASASFHAGAGFVGDYPPPGEVAGFLFTDRSTMTWAPERSVGTYDVYRDALAGLTSGAMGACFASGSSSEGAVDAGTPASGQGWFYLVTARNLLGEEGTKGSGVGATERPNAAPCP